MFKTLLRPGRPRQAAIAGLTATVVAGVATWLLWPDPPRQREYLDTTACLLTDERGVTAEPAAPVWAAMQAASATSLVRAQYLSVNGPQTTENATVHLASLAASQCHTIIAVGTAQTDAVDRVAGDHPKITFRTVGGGTPTGNVHTLDTATPETLQRQIQELLDEQAS